MFETWRRFLAPETVERLNAVLPRFADATAALKRPDYVAPAEPVTAAVWHAIRAARTPAEVSAWQALETEVVAAAHDWFRGWIHARLARLEARGVRHIRDDGSTTFVANELYLTLRRSFLNGFVPPNAEQFAYFLAENIGRTISNLFRSAARRRSRVTPNPARADDESFDPTSDGPPPESQAELFDMIAAVERRVARLTVEYREVYRRRYFLEMTVEEIALAAGTSDDTIRRRLARLRELLASVADADDATDPADPALG